MLASMTGVTNQDGTPVATMRTRPNVQVGKPSMMSRTASMSRTAYSTSATGYGNTMDASFGNFYSPELSTDFLELPQARYEQWAFYRFFARTHPYVSQALRLHTELPLSKIRISPPAAKNHELAMQATRFCARWAEDINLLQKLMGIVYEFHLIGVVNIFAEDNNPECPDELLYDEENYLTADGEVITRQIEKQDRSAAAAWLKKNYKGWTSLRVLPPEQVLSETFSFTDERMVELIPDQKTKKLIMQAESGDVRAQKIAKSIPREIVEAVREGKNIPLNTDPEAGSFVYIMDNGKSDYESFGHSILEPCMRTLVQQDKCRQANASIASRHMTPIRVVWSENLSAPDLEALRDQVDMAVQDPDFSIVSNYQINWEEMGSEQRLLDLTSENEMANRELYAGLGVTEGLLTGESSYSGDKISLEVINTRYMLLREMLQNFVNTNLFKSMCARMGFVETDDDGNDVILTPKLGFSRLAIKDSADTYEQLLNLYSKGSLGVSEIYSALNLDPVAVKEELAKDLFTLNDATFNEALRGLYGEVGRTLADPANSDAVEQIAKNMKIRYTKPAPEGGDRFGG